LSCSAGRAQIGEQGIEAQLGDPAVALAIGCLEPLECLVCVATPGVDLRDLVSQRLAEVFNQLRQCAVLSLPRRLASQRPWRSDIDPSPSSPLLIPERARWPALPQDVSMGIGRYDRDEQRARLDLPANRGVPSITPTKLALVKPHFDACRTQPLADPLSGSGVLGRVTEKDGSLAACG